MIIVLRSEKTFRKPICCFGLPECKTQILLNYDPATKIVLKGRPVNWGKYRNKCTPIT